VLKITKPPKERDLEPIFQEALRGLVDRLPFLKLKSLLVDAPISNARDRGRADFILKAQIGTRTWTLIAEGKRLGQPREVKTGILQLKHYLSLLPTGTPAYGLLLAPFISEESGRLCAEAGIGYLDLAGNARLSFDQVFIETRSSENPFHEKRAVKTVFSPKATRVIRVLLQGPLRAWRTVQLAEAADVSLGHVSGVKQLLLAQEWAAEDKSGLRLVKPSAVLDAWAAIDRWSERTREREYSLLINEPAEIAEKLHACLGKQRHAFTQWFAAALRHPHASVPVTTAYVDRFPDEELLKNKLLARPVSSGGRLRLVVPKDAGVFRPLQTVKELPLVSDVQIYLDVIHAGLRGDEAAAELRRWPDFAGGWS
jgi:hypothetical protein